MTTQSLNSNCVTNGKWLNDFASRWNSDSYSLFILHGNIFDLFPVKDAKDQVSYGSLKSCLAQRFPKRSSLMFYDISDGLSFGTEEMRGAFFSWYSSFARDDKATALPKDFPRLAPILRQYFFFVSEQTQRKKDGTSGVTLIIDFPEKIAPNSDDATTSVDERMSLVSLMKWAVSAELRRLDVGVILLTETVGKIHPDLLQNPYIAQIRIDIPNIDERRNFIESPWLQAIINKPNRTDWSDLTTIDLASRTSGLNLIRIKQVIAEAINNKQKVTADHVITTKKRLIEEYCQGMVSFKEPKAEQTLDLVATHVSAKKRLRDLATLIRTNRLRSLERGVLIPGRVGVGKSFIVDCFASECCLPVLTIGEFRSKWVGDTESRQARILLTIRALGPVIVVIDEAHAVLGNYGGDGDNGLSARTYAAFAAHIGDSSLRGRELWIAMTSRPDLMAIDMKRQGRFGLCIPLFPAQSPDEVIELFTTVAKTKKMTLTPDILQFIKDNMGGKALTGSDIDSILARSQEPADLDGRDEVTVDDIKQAVSSFIDPLDRNILRMQELAAVLACSDRRYLPEQYATIDDAKRADFATEFDFLQKRRA